MKVFTLLIFLIVRSNGVDWKTINDFKVLFEDYRAVAQNTIITVERVINTTKLEANIFIENAYKNNPILGDINNSQQSTNDKCSSKLIERENLNKSFMVQVFQLHVLLNNRIIDIKERLSSINTTLDLYQDVADSKYLNCQVLNDSCKEETKGWLDNEIQSLSCAISPNCHSHSIRKKRSVCSPGQFKCRNVKCIDGYNYCDGQCDCHDRNYNPYNYCSDEPSGCVRDCTEFRCRETFKCISTSLKCDGVDDCGDNSDEEGCPKMYTRANCSIDAGDFLCGNKKCIELGMVCDGQDDCGDGSDEGERCSESLCSTSCSRTGGVCLSGSEGPRCLYECPPGMFETLAGCSLEPEPSPSTLEEAIQDTTRLTARYTARFKYLKMKTITEFSKSLQEFARCKKGEFTLLSKTIKFSSKFVLNDSTAAKSKTHVKTTSVSVHTSTETYPQPLEVDDDLY